ncbi:DUF485 domain-containing protein (plasmid) [Cupriavidus necator]|nr:DUF485 domain-containing protein [Cupriavidus necator]QQX89089.1 DUF485 domain-containing protein [Cupriavidus necator]
MSSQLLSVNPADDGWIAETKEFSAASKGRYYTVVVLLFTFVLYYFSLLLCAAYWREFMAIRVIGPINIGLLFAISQYPMAGLIAAVYVVKMRKIDKAIEASSNKLNRGEG